MSTLSTRPRPERALPDPEVRVNREQAAAISALVSTTHARSRRWLRPVVVERSIMAADALLIVCCGALSAYVYRWYAVAEQVDVTTYATAATLVAVNFVLLIIIQHGYRLKSISNPISQLRMAFATWTAVFAALIAAGFTMKVSQEFSRGAVLSFFLLGLFAILVGRLITSLLTSRALRDGLFTNSRIVVVAEQGLAASSWSLHQLRQHGYRPSRILEISTADLSSPLMISTIHPRLADLIAYCRDNRVEQVFLLFSWNRQYVIDCVLDVFKILPIPVHLIPDASVARFLKYPAVTAGDTWTSELRRAPLSRGEQMVKRVFDLCSAASAIVLFAPIMLITAILIKLDSKGPVLFRQTRNGFNDRGFRIYKFRTMTVTEDGPTIVQAQKHDKRVTRIGRWLRKTSIDELPQLLNVLQGDMALVGPRPHAAAHNTEYEQLIGNYAFRHHVKPGITGWAQVNGYRGETNSIGLMEKRVEFDLWYINNWSLWLDVSIVLKTAITSLRQSRAY